MSTTTTIYIRNFSGKTLPFEVNLDENVTSVRQQVAKMTLRSGTTLEPILQFNGHEMRNGRKLSYYGVKEKSLVHVLPPRKQNEKRLQLKCIASGKSFSIEVSPNISVDQLKKDIEVEERIEVYSLAYSESANEEDSEWDIITTEEMHPLEPGDALISSFPFSVSTNYDYTIHVLRPPPPLVPPQTFPVNLALYDDGTEKTLTVDVQYKMTLGEFRNAVQRHHGVSIDQDILVLVGKELNREDNEDIPIWDLGFVPGCTIHAVPYLAFTVQTPEDKMFGPMLLHPLTKLKDIRAMLEEEQRTSDESDATPLDYYGFTLDGREHLKEWRSLWGIGAFSGSVLYLRPRTISLTISCSFDVFMMEVEENDTIAEVKQQLQLVSDDQVHSGGRLYYRYKLLQDEKTVKEEGLVGGERLQYHSLRAQSPRLSQWMHPLDGETSNGIWETNRDMEEEAVPDERTSDLCADGPSDCMGSERN